MKMTLLALLAVPLLLSACADTQPTKVVVRQTTDLGFGFRCVRLIEPVNSSFERIGHPEYLYYQDQQLCRVGACSVSPSGRYAVYQEGRSGDLFLFRCAAGRSTRLTRDFAGVADSFQWREDANAVEVRFATASAARTFSLQ